MKFDRAYSPYQFAFFRIALGAYLVLTFAQLIPHAAELFGTEVTQMSTPLHPSFGLFPNLLYWLDSSLAATGFVVLLTLLAGWLATGLARLPVAFLLWYGWLCVFNGSLLNSSPGIAYVGWLLLGCSLIPSGEPLTWKGDEEKQSGWQLPFPFFAGAWVLLALGYASNGLAKMSLAGWREGTPLSLGVLALEVFFVPLCLWNRTRMFAWFALLVVNCASLAMTSSADLVFGVVLMHLFTFDPRWFPPKTASGIGPVVFFDGVCGLCNASIDQLFRFDREGLFKVAPLQGKTAASVLGSEAGEESGMDSIILKDENGLHKKSDAIIAIVSRMGGVWRFAEVFRVIPRPLRDAGYSFIAKNRYRWFGKKETCRLPTPSERARFLD